MLDLTKLLQGGAILNTNLTAERTRALYSNNWDHGDVVNHNGDVRVVNPATGAPVNGYATIMALGNKLSLIAKRTFITNFKSVSGASSTASDLEIMAYFDKNLSAQNAAALYNGNPRVNGSEVEKGATNDKVKFDGKEYKNNDMAAIIAAKKAKIDADNATKLTSAKTAAQNALQTLLDDTSNNQTKLTDEEVKTQLNKTDPNLINGTTIKNWKDYINDATTTSEVDRRKNKIETAISELRKAKKPLPFDATAARAAATAAVKNHWKTKSNDQTEASTVNGKKIKEVLGADWEKEFNDKNDQTTIDSKKTELIGKIDEEKNKEKKEPEQKIPEEKVKEVIKNVLGDSNVEIKEEVVSSWQSFNNDKSELKTTEQIQEFLGEIKEDKKNEFVQILNELPGIEPLNGANEQEKINDFLAKQKAEIVIKAIFSYKIRKDDTFRNETEAKMENEKNAEGQPLDEKVYSSQDGKYNEEAMARYLFEKKTGQSHQFATKKQDNENNPVGEEGHWDKWKYWYIGGGIIVLLVAGLMVVFWDKLTGSKEGEE
jgi:hypothetical protein